VLSLEKLAKLEAEDNEAEGNRQLGKFVRYGQVIQLKHVMTQRFVRMSSTEAAELDVLNMCVDLSAAHSKRNKSFFTLFVLLVCLLNTKGPFFDAPYRHPLSPDAPL